jgi:hypothetical protein
MKQTVIEGEVSMNSYRGIGVTGTEVGTEEKWKLRFANKGNALFQNIPLGAKIRIEVSVAEEASE